MRLYETTAGTIVGTLADAKRVAKAQGGVFKQIEVPVDKPGLIAYLNDRPVGTEQPAPDLLTATANQSDAIIKLKQKVRIAEIKHDISVEEEIGRANLARAIRLTEHCGNRLIELAHCRKEKSE